MKIPLPVDDGKLGEALQGLLGPGAPERPVSVPIAGYDPGGRVAHLVDQRVPQSIPAVYHLAKAQLIANLYSRGRAVQRDASGGIRLIR